MSSPKYIIYAPSYDYQSGGSIVLHKLCHFLNELGENAFLWPFPMTREKRRKKRLRDKFARTEFRTSPDFSTPLVPRKAINDFAIVVYPEVTAGNPLGARHVVRWLLHRPGFHTGTVDYGADELFFKFDDYCDDPAVTGGDIDQLFLFTLNPCYKDLGRLDRSGSCYMLRKGKGRPIVHDLENSIQIDGMSHEEIAEIFNQTEIFYSYDDATMYSQFAAICGCTSVVIPMTYDSREAWVRDHPLSLYGIAHGLDDVAHSVETKHLVRDYLEELERNGIQSVENFIAKTRRHFGFDFALQAEPSLVAGSR